MSARIGCGWMAAAALMVGTAAVADEPAKKTATATAQKDFAWEAGVWDADVTVYLPGPDGKPSASTSKAVETNRVLGGKWLVSDFQGEFGGQSFQGHGQYGYDAKKGKYVGTWLDSMSTHIDTMEGTYDPTTKVLTMYCDMENPETGKPTKAKFTTLYDGNTRVFTEQLKSEGAPDYVKFMEITYKKRAK